MNNLLSKIFVTLAGALWIALMAIAVAIAVGGAPAASPDEPDTTSLTCIDREIMIDNLTLGYGEHLVTVNVMPGADTRVEIYGDPEDGSWSMLLIINEGETACLLKAGWDYEGPDGAVSGPTL